MSYQDESRLPRRVPSLPNVLCRRELGGLRTHHRPLALLGRSLLPREPGKGAAPIWLGYRLTGLGRGDWATEQAAGFRERVSSRLQKLITIDSLVTYLTICSHDVILRL